MISPQKVNITEFYNGKHQHRQLWWLPLYKSNTRAIYRPKFG